ncbi:uncharacterized protein LOC112548009 [Alligator sinensis]|uniref:Uncharacterized protein LOC112548009 n=1 Tax=Alligator sinensis TaxID=38654 RepID=A0A3Q0FND9_ALLSI|nr:uncharacterized protein LOC112548009 [Alligator sinensis]
MSPLPGASEPPGPAPDTALGTLLGVGDVGQKPAFPRAGSMSTPAVDPAPFAVQCQRQDNVTASCTCTSNGSRDRAGPRSKAGKAASEQERVGARPAPAPRKGRRAMGWQERPSPPADSGIALSPGGSSIIILHRPVQPQGLSTGSALVRTCAGMRRHHLGGRTQQLQHPLYLEPERSGVEPGMGWVARAPGTALAWAPAALSPPRPRERLFIVQQFLINHNKIKKLCNPTQDTGQQTQHQTRVPHITPPLRPLPICCGHQRGWRPVGKAQHGARPHQQGLMDGEGPTAPGWRREGGSSGK